MKKETLLDNLVSYYVFGDECDKPYSTNTAVKMLKQLTTEEEINYRFANRNNQED